MNLKPTQHRRRQRSRPRPLMQTLRGTQGAIDLASIMVGVLVIGIIGGVIAATVFAVIPWAQDNAAQGDLRAVASAEGVFAASHAGAYADLPTLQGPAAFAAGGGAPGQPGASVSAAGALLPAVAQPLAINANAAGFVAAEISQTGMIFYVTSLSATVSSSAPTLPAGLSLPTFGPTYALGSSVTVGARPAGVAVNSATGVVYTANMSAGTVSVVSGSPSVLTATVAVGATPEAIAVDASRNMTYAANLFGNSLSVLDGSSNAITATIPVGNYPAAVAVDPVTHRVYVAGDNVLTVIDGLSNSVVATIATNVIPAGLAIDTTANVVYLVGGSAGTLSVIDGGTNAVTSTTAVGASPAAVVLSAGKIYVANGDSTISVLDGTTHAVTATIALSAAGRALTVDPATNRIFVVPSTGNTISVISGATAKIVASIVMPSTPAAAAVDTTGRLWVASWPAANASGPGILSSYTAK